MRLVNGERKFGPCQASPSQALSTAGWFGGLKDRTFLALQLAPMQMFDAAEIRANTPWSALIDGIGVELVNGSVEAPDRHVHQLDHPDGSQSALLLMPSWVAGDLVVVKTVTYFPANAGSEIATVNAAVLVFDGVTGQLAAVLDGDELTARRTAACSALAGRYLARADSSRLLIVGTGQLAPNMVRAHASVRDLTKIEVWGRRQDQAVAVVDQLEREGYPAQVTTDLEESMKQAHIISCVTGATEPIVNGEWLAP
ncbi:MAG: hypothetical protein GY724_00705, partial [Actinomycetia bacterium]|nr:hypothetical protein [Actinomycetes bacterium]